MSSSFSAIQDAISPGRLQPYRQEGDTETRTLARYVWNAYLGESFYGPLQHLEISLRNALFRAISVHKKRDNPDWLTENSSWLSERDCAQIRAAKEFLEERQKPTTQGHLVSELNFGFWTGLLRNEYESILWPRIVVYVFPNFPPNKRPRAVLAERFTKIRHLRNRIFHHEPIWNRPALHKDYAEVLEALGWLSHEMLTLAKICQTFPRIHCEEQLQELEEDLAPHFGH